MLARGTTDDKLYSKCVYRLISVYMIVNTIFDFKILYGLVADDFNDDSGEIIFYFFMQLTLCINSVYFYFLYVKNGR